MQPVVLPAESINTVEIKDNTLYIQLPYNLTKTHC